MRRAHAWRTAGILVALLAWPGLGGADVVDCQRALVKAGDKLARTVATQLRKCEARRRTGKLPPETVCLAETKTAAALAKAAAKLHKATARKCGGPDKSCGTGDDESLAAIGWPSACPDFAATGCTGVIDDCADVADCLICVDRAAATHALALAYDALVPTDKRAERKLHKCQGAIGKETVKLLAAKSKALARCWDQRLRERHADACPSPGDGKAAPAIARAAARLEAQLCKRCGGPDKACAGGDDFTPADIGFVDHCPAVADCGGPVATLPALIDCLTCVAMVDADCTASLAVPALAAYPVACAPAPPTPTATVTPTPSATPTPSPTQTDAATPTGTATPEGVATPCPVAAPGTITTTATIALTSPAAVGAASLVLGYPRLRVSLPAPGGGAEVRARVADLTAGDLFDRGAPNNQDGDGDGLADQVRFTLVATAGVNGAILAVTFDRCDAAVTTIATDYACTLADVVGTDGITPIAGATCAVGLAHAP